MCVFAGSLPREVDIDIYARLIRELRRLGVTTLVDTDGDPLRRAVRAEPDLISPNVLEAEELVGHEFNDDEDRIIAVREMVGLGAREAIMTMPDGCFAQMLPQRAERRPAPVPRARVPAGAIEPRATVGSGDAFLAGFVAARYAGKPTAECLAYGVACGAESTQHLGAGLVDPERVQRLLGEIRGGTSGTTGRSRARPSVAWVDRPPSSPRIPEWKLRSAAARRPAALTDSTTSPSFPRAARATPMTSTSPGRSGRTGSSCRSSPRRWTASSRRRRRASSASWAASPS